jgi:hypothetical protein
MSEVSLSKRFPVSVEKLWELIGGFNALPQWHPAVARSELEEGGSVRRLALVGGGEIVERLEKMSEDEFSYTYSIIDSPLPVRDYSSTLKLEDDGEGGCRVTWSGRFQSSGVAEPDAMKVVEGIYRAGFDNLRKMLTPI